MNTQKMSVLYLKRSEASSVINFGKLEPSHMPSLNTLRVMKYKSKKENQLHSDLIIALSLLKSLSSYNNIIKDISYGRFFVHYWAVTELNMYRLCSKNSIAPWITIDATSGIVSTFKLITSRKTSSVFLYEVGVMDYSNESQFLVAHMLSERHNNDAISHWPKEWLKSKIPSPKVFMTDQF